MKKFDEKKYELSFGKVVFLYIFYFLIMTVGITVLAVVLCNDYANSTTKDILAKTIYASLSSSGMLCSIKYIKKLYKACINLRVVTNENSIRQLGNLAYFIFRPLFSCAFAVIAIAALLSGLFIVTGGLDYIINEKFLFLCIIVSSIIGFSTGTLLEKFESLSEKTINKLEE